MLALPKRNHDGACGNICRIALQTWLRSVALTSGSCDLEWQR